MIMLPWQTAQMIMLLYRPVSSKIQDDSSIFHTLMHIGPPLLPSAFLCTHFGWIDLGAQKIKTHIDGDLHIWPTGQQASPCSAELSSQLPISLHEILSLSSLFLPISFYQYHSMSDCHFHLCLCLFPSASIIPWVTVKGLPSLSLPISFDQYHSMSDCHFYLCLCLFPFNNIIP